MPANTDSGLRSKRRNVARSQKGRASSVSHPAGMTLHLTLEVHIMRTITTQEQVAVVGGIDTVTVPAKKKDDGSTGGLLQMATQNSGANSAGSAGGGGAKTATTKIVCIDTVEQTCQTAQITNITFGITEVSMTQTLAGARSLKRVFVTR
jgi:hypothetical protein